MATRFTFWEGARLRILTVSGNVTVTGEDRPDGEIEPGREPHISDDQHAVEFKSRSNNLHIRVPAGMNVSVGTVSGKVKLKGLLGAIKVSTVSSTTQVASAREAHARSISGDITIDACTGSCRAYSKSGVITLPGRTGG